MKITITKRNVLTYKVGQSYDVADNLAKHLIGRGLAEDVKPVIVPVEAPIVEVKEEKTAPATKEEKFKKGSKKTK